MTLPVEEGVKTNESMIREIKTKLDKYYIERCRVELENKLKMIQVSSCLLSLLPEYFADLQFENTNESMTDDGLNLLISKMYMCLERHYDEIRQLCKSQQYYAMRGVGVGLLSTIACTVSLHHFIGLIAMGVAAPHFVLPVLIIAIPISFWLCCASCIFTLRSLEIESSLDSLATWCKKETTEYIADNNNILFSGKPGTKIDMDQTDKLLTVDSPRHQTQML